MEQFWRKKSFKILQREWNKKLVETGFVDAEIEIKSDRILKQRATNSYRQATQLERESRLEYYCFLGYLAHNTVFPSELEKFVMIRHAEGASIREITDELTLRGIVRHRQTIRHVIRRWQTKWGIRTWSLREMNLKPK